MINPGVKNPQISRSSTDLEITQVAAAFKSKNKMSYADCFAAALAKLHKVELVTGDHEFKPLAGEIKIMWLR